MISVRLCDLLDDPAAWLDRVAGGETLRVEDERGPLAMIAPIAEPPRQDRPYGLAAGEFTVPDDFDAPLPEAVLAEFEGR